MPCAALVRAVRSRARWGLVLAAAALVVGCSSDSDPQDDESRPDGPAGIEITLMQYTHDESNRVLVLHVTNAASDETLELDGVAVEAAGFDGEGRAAVRLNLPPGASVDVRMPYGRPRCSDAALADDVVVEVGLPQSDGVVEVVPSEAQLLAVIHDRECSAKRMRELVPMAWAERWERTGRGKDHEVHGVLRLGPVGPGQTARLVSMEGTVVFSVQAPALPMTLQSGDFVDLRVDFRSARCDPHVLADAPQGFEFMARLRPPGAATDGTQDVLVPLEPDVRTQILLTNGWLEQCGFPPRVTARAD